MVKNVRVGADMGQVGAAVGVFVGTDVDDLVVLTVLFLSSRAGGRPRPWQIVIGQYVGIGVLFGVSVVAALGLSIVPDHWVGLLGLVPIALGVHGLVGVVRARGEGEGSAPAVASGLFSVASITVANGADNIAVYTPMFRTLGVTGSVVTGAVFVVLVGVWCAVAAWLGSHRRVVRVVERFGDWIVPGVFIAIGAIIVAESGVIARLTHLG